MRVARSISVRLTDGYRLWRAHGAEIRRARLLATCADELMLRRPRHWRARAERLYRRTTRTLGGLHLAGRAQSHSPSLDADADADPARAAHRVLRELAAARRSFALGLAALAAALAGAAAVVLMLLCLVAPGLRHRLFPKDLAARRPWLASSADDGEARSGIGPSSSRHQFMHTELSEHPWVEIDLGALHLIRSVEVVNRTDCCQARCLPLDVEVPEGDGWRLIAQRHAPFDRWRHDVTPVRAQVVRLRVGGTSYLHLKRVSIYGE